MKKRILTVDDEEEMLLLLQRVLSKEGYVVIPAVDAEEAFEKIKDSKPDMIILDLKLPDIGGYEICRIIRESPETKNIPVIMLTSMGQVEHKVRGLEAGADDYIAKPFDHGELISRVKSLFRRASFSETPEDVLKSGGLVIYPDRYEVTIAKEKVALTPKEFELLHLLMKRNGKVIRRQNLLETIWGITYMGSTRTLDVHIRYLRRKLKKHARKIVTVEGVGYKFSEAGE